MMLSPMEVREKERYDTQIDMYVKALEKIGVNEVEKQPFSLGARGAEKVNFEYGGHRFCLRHFALQTVLCLGDSDILEEFTHGQGIPPRFMFSAQKLNQLLPDIVKAIDSGKNPSWQARRRP